MKKRNKLLDIAKKMPPLFHKLPNEDFDIHKSEVVKWLISQPEIMQYIFSHIEKIRGENAYIVYDRKTGKWRGVEHDDMVSVFHGDEPANKNTPTEKNSCGQW